MRRRSLRTLRGLGDDVVAEDRQFDDSAVPPKPRLVRASEAAIEEIENFCSDHAPEAEFRRGGWLWTATTGAQLGAWDKVVSRADALAPGTFRRPDPREVAHRTGSPQHLAGVIEPSNATVQPAALVRAMRRRSKPGCKYMSSPRSRTSTAARQ